MYRKFGKRMLDFFGALLLLMLLWPLLMLLAVLVRIKLGRPALFRQERPGYKERIFTLYKFRSMTDERDASGALAADEVRLTRFGKLLRSTSMDELPELINILKGDMSFVGPRPLLVHYLPLYNEFQRRRHDVTPGLTGWAQVNGRNSISWQDKFRLDVEYTERLSFSFDLKIFFMTLGKILKRSGISQTGSATMEPFKGNDGD